MFGYRNTVVVRGEFSGIESVLRRTRRAALTHLRRKVTWLS
jgi:hypothetical protein